DLEADDYEPSSGFESFVLDLKMCFGVLRFRSCADDECRYPRARYFIEVPVTPLSSADASLEVKTFDRICFASD
ncbi:unnamed protein product, partial [Sphenostylis stenocarpa]